jgi:membrane-associated phospholipid phosphatase
VALVEAGWVRGADVAIGSVAYYDSPCWLLQVSKVASLLFAGELCLIYAAALALVCARAGQARLGLAIVVVLVLVTGIEFGGKLLLHQPSPELAGTRAGCAGLGYPLTEVKVANSLPSGYSIRAGYFLVLLAALIPLRWPRLRRPARLLLVPILLLLGVTRLVSAAHWASDVVAGLLLGGAAACLVLAAGRATRRGPRPDAERAAPPQRLPQARADRRGG